MGGFFVQKMCKKADCFILLPAARKLAPTLC
jgi:hypothetical protein